MSYIATVKRCGWMIVIRVVGGADCLWMNMYLDTHEWQMTCDSDMGSYAYWFGAPMFPTESFAKFCAGWMRNERNVLRECVLERGLPMVPGNEKEEQRDENYTPDQKRFAKICKEIIAPELRKFCEQEEKA